MQKDQPESQPKRMKCAYRHILYRLYRTHPLQFLAYREEELAMPRKECHKMDEKLRFVSRFRDGEKIAAPSRTRRCASAAAIPIALGRVHGVGVASLIGEPTIE